MTPMGPKLSFLEVLVNIRQFIGSVRCFLTRLEMACMPLYPKFLEDQRLGTKEGGVKTQ